MPAAYRAAIVVDLLYNTTDTAAHFRLARESGLTAMQHSVTSLRADTALAFKEMAEMRNIIDDNADQLIWAGRAADIRRAKETGKLAVLMGVQNPKFVLDELHYIRAAYEIGLRVLMLTHNVQNYLGTGCAEPDHGLTPFGRRVIAECNRLGMLIDVAHCGPRTTLEAIECSEHPVLCTHSNPRAVAPNDRNKDDEAILALARKGGVIGIASFSPTAYSGRGGQPTIEDVLNCYDYAIKLVGPDHVALGSDTNERKFNGLPRAVWEAEFSRNGRQGSVVKHLDWYELETWYAKGAESVTQLPDLAEGLLRRGHSEATVTKVLGGNALRVIETVCG
jgi:membrane dipeptidase